MTDFALRGAGDFLKLSKALKAAGRTDLRKELHKGLRDAAKPLIPEVRAAARSELPRRGGLAEQVASEPMRVQVRTGRDPGVRIVVARRRGGARMSNRGTIRHPVFGNREMWVEQQVDPGWFDDTLGQNAPQVREELEAAMYRVVEQIIRDAR